MDEVEKAKMTYCFAGVLFGFLVFWFPFIAIQIGDWIKGLHSPHHKTGVYHVRKDEDGKDVEIDA